MCTKNILEEEGLYGADNGREQAGDVSVCERCAGNSGCVQKLCLCDYPGTERRTGETGLQSGSWQGSG